MSQENQGTDSFPMENTPVKRKRGRPRKDGNLVRGEPASTSLPVTDMVRRNRRRRVDQIDDAMVGQVVSGALEGSFDAGYLLTVKVGNTNTVLRGVVFEPGLSVPISVANDVAPHVKMFKRNEISLPTQVQGTNLQSEQNNGRLVKVSGNEGVLASNVSPPVKQVPRAPQLLPSQAQANPMAFSKGEVNDTNNVPKTAPHALQPEESKAKSSPSLPAKGLAGEASDDANHVDQVSSQPAASQTENRTPTDVMQNDESGHPTRDAPHSLPPEDNKAKISPSRPAKGVAGEASGDANHAVQVSSQVAASQTENWMSTDVMQNDKSSLPPREAGGLAIDAGQVVQVSMQTAAAPQIEKKKSIDLLTNDKSDLPTSEPEGVPSDINQMVHVPSQVEAMKSTYVLPNEKLVLPAREPEGPLNDASQVIEDSLQPAAPQRENRKSANVLPDDKTDLLTRELDSSNQASLVKAEQVVQPVVKGEPSATQPLQMVHDRAVAPAEIFQENEAAALIKQPLKNSITSEDSEFIPSIEPSIEKLPGSESIDQINQVESHAMISELQPGLHADDALTSGGSEVKLNCIPVSDPPETVAAQPNNEVTNLLEKKASPKGDTPQDLAAKLSDEIPGRFELSHLDGRAKTDVFEVTEGHIESESQCRQPVGVFHRGSSVQICDTSLSMHIEESISKDTIPSEQKSQALKKVTTPFLSVDLGAEIETTESLLPKEVPGHQTSTSTLPIQTEDGVSEDTFPSVQSQCDPVESKVTDSMNA
ncbi:uncharacterized protein LOC122069691 [Macadamia integrifolia]|uniref:uncharacterized protein LOC122069691 n=1 Tax=Macadamia integrifolia TaxID=60698 RepID=UPI001C4EB937|nr:uncharacterized protein LOC122069691 [Macadamia integrifolia]XP_042489704.1 uncharacterized protein LOC122069691 [Macadamia integrifolia]XP_042489711.1 uncharacterized protein LOC122069691 [Macadamia integrifolia]XP_042489714.1 uncharacterized protein LOC122069691 [Macadamia integrifolia]XP_042489720.1 uncharacterized protein LOC122069691 [Macadamia integrifolia]